MSAKPVTGQPILQVAGVSMSFGAVTALADVSMRMAPGEITGLVGDNGAGKSTLVKLIAGVLQPSSGTILFDGKPAAFTSPAAARNAGIETVYQDLALAPNMPVWANIFTGRELTRGPRFLHVLDRKAMIERTRAFLSRYDMNVPPIEGAVEGLSGGQRQIIAIARAAAWGSRLIIMDEPTAALGVAETRAVEAVIRSLRAEGHSILIISHNLDQVFRLTDAIWVLRRGHMVGSARTQATTPNRIVAMITGAAEAVGGGSDGRA
ncbi:MAG: sugar ABC transporter ATP-binding protein [Rubellimicrobium sp.]|nr:sugar ABC transporter ATP-binding protein [Rubellimicrobium sp.]